MASVGARNEASRPSAEKETEERYGELYQRNRHRHEGIGGGGSPELTANLNPKLIEPSLVDNDARQWTGGRTY